MAGPARADEAVSAEPIEAVEIELLSYNTWGVPFPFSRGRRRARLEGTSTFLEQHGADIVGLQELFGRSRELLDPGGQQLIATDEPETGLALLSAFPTTLEREVVFAPERERDVLTRKGFLHASVTLPGAVPLQVFVTHLEAGLARERRERAARRLLEAVEATEGPAVILGDFNLSDAESDRKAAASFLEAGWKDLGEGTGPTHRFLDHRYDRIYLRDGDTWCISPLAQAVLGPGDGASKGLSDHWPVWARVSVEPCDTQAQAD